jgi:hypothetical protein
MKTLDEIFLNEKLQFDQFEPEDGHFERFQQKLTKQNTTKHKSKKPLYIRIAAIALIVITLSVGGYFRYAKKDLSNTIDQKEIKLSDLSPEYKEVETYLKNSVSTKLKEFEKIECSKTDVSKQQVVNELNNIDTTYRKLQEELKMNGKNEKVINAMINCYQLKVEVLNQVIKQLNKNC